MLRRSSWSRTARWAAVGLAGTALMLAGCTGPPSSDSSTKTSVGATGSGSSGCGPRMGTGAVTPGTTQNRTLSIGAVTGSYRLTVPHSYRPGSPMPLVLLFYGFGSDPLQFLALTHLPSKASSDGYLVAVPQAQGSEWQFSGQGTDAAFVNRLLQEIDGSYCIDQHRVFAAGFSAGAAFTLFYTCTHQAQIAAIVTVAVEFQLGCTRPVSILAFHGTEDPLVPYQDGAVGLSLPGVKVRGTELNMADWAGLDHCRSTPKRTRVGSQVIKQQWSGCIDGTSVELYSVLGGGHSWPGADPRVSVGLTTQQVSATTQALAFFGRS